MGKGRAAVGPAGINDDLVVSERRQNKKTSDGREKRARGKETSGKAASARARDGEMQGFCGLRLFSKKHTVCTVLYPMVCCTKTYFLFLLNKYARMTLFRVN